MQAGVWVAANPTDGPHAIDQAKVQRDFIRAVNEASRYPPRRRRNGWWRSRDRGRGDLFVGRHPHITVIAHAWCAAGRADHRAADRRAGDSRRAGCRQRTGQQRRTNGHTRDGQCGVAARTRDKRCAEMARSGDQKRLMAVGTRVRRTARRHTTYVLWRATPTGE